jgi:hypothetical protein
VRVPCLDDLLVALLFCHARLLRMRPYLKDVAGPKEVTARRGVTFR